MDLHQITHQALPFVIAEISGNHGGSLEDALSLVSAASEAGADAVKIQLYSAPDIATSYPTQNSVIRDQTSPWYGRSLYELYEQAGTPKEWIKPIFDHAHSIGILCFASVFDISSVDVLESVDCPLYKIASFEHNHHELLEAVSKTGKPIIASLGVSSFEDTIRLYSSLKRLCSGNFALLQCTSDYPADPINSNLLAIRTLRRIFDCPIGLSDHTKGTAVPICAVGVGAQIIEKHITLDDNSMRVDSAFSLTPKEFTTLVHDAKTAYRALGSSELPINSPSANSVFKRSLYFSASLTTGATIRPGDLQLLRPADGLDPSYTDHILGLKLTCNVSRGQPVTKDCFT